MPENLSHYATGALKYVQASLTPATEKSALRLAVCNSCNLLTADRRCGVCQCYVDKKVKLDAENCPLQTVVTVQQAQRGDVLVLLDKWGQYNQIMVPSGFARVNDTIMFPTHSQAINVQTEQTANVLK